MYRIQCKSKLENVCKAEYREQHWELAANQNRTIRWGRLRIASNAVYTSKDHSLDDEINECFEQDYTKIQPTRNGRRDERVKETGTTSPVNQWLDVVLVGINFVLNPIVCIG